MQIIAGRLRTGGSTLRAAARRRFSINLAYYVPGGDSARRRQGYASSSHPDI